MTFFLVIDHKFRISPLFSLFQYISPLFRENYYSHYFGKFSPPVLYKFTCFLHALRVFCFPPTLTMMHQSMHVLDAPDKVSLKLNNRLEKHILNMKNN